MGSRHHECARSGDQIHFLCTLHRLARVGAGLIEAAEALLCRAGYRAGKAGAACGSGHTHGNPQIDVMDDHGGIVERAWAAGTHLVAWSPPAQSSSTAGRFAETGTA